MWGLNILIAMIFIVSYIIIGRRKYKEEVVRHKERITNELDNLHQVMDKYYPGLSKHIYKQ